MAASEQELKFEARLKAMEFVWAQTYNMICTNLDIRPDTPDEIEASLLNALSIGATVEGVTPAMSDHLTDETVNEIPRIYGVAKRLRESFREGFSSDTSQKF